MSRSSDPFRPSCRCGGGQGSSVRDMVMPVRLCVRTILGVACLGGGLSACGGRGPSHAATSAAKPAARVQLFTADVRSGPDSGLGLSGVLTGTVAASGQIRGTLTGHGDRVTLGG